MLNSYLRVINKHMDKFTAERIHNYRSRKYECVNNYESMLSDKAVQLEQLGSRLASLEAASKDKVDQLESLLTEREATLDKIYRSRGWKTLQVYYKLRDRILGRERNRS